METTINPMPELAPLLKQLRLSGVMDSLAQRNREAIEGKLAYTEFLALVIQDEVARREQKKFASRVRRAGFRGEKTLEGFDFTQHPHLNQELIRDLATCRFIEEKVSLLIVGPCGTGKSHIAQAIGHAAVRHPHDEDFHDLVAERYERTATVITSCIPSGRVGQFDLIA